MSHDHADHAPSDHRKAYVRFALMILTSSLVMYLLMYLNTYEFDHVYFSQTRLYMTLMMASAMSIIMLSFMLSMHKIRGLNFGIYAGSAVLFIAALALVRTQATVGDVSYMKAMIPHHSIAILTSERARIADPRVRVLADQIIETQRKEIADMNALIADLETRK